MNRKIKLDSVQLELSDIAKWYCLNDDKEQASLFNEIGEAWAALQYDKGMQMCYMVSHLNKKAIQFLTEMAGFINLREEKENNDGK